MKLSVLVILIGLISVLVASCATPPQPIHQFGGYYKYNDGNHVIITGDGNHICMPMKDFEFMYESYNLYYEIEE